MNFFKCKRAYTNLHITLEKSRLLPLRKPSTFLLSVLPKAMRGNSISLFILFSNNSNLHNCLY